MLLKGLAFHIAVSKLRFKANIPIAGIIKHNRRGVGLAGLFAE